MFYEADSGNLVSRQPGLQTDFGDGCFTYCSTEFQSLKTRYGTERVLLRNCNFVRNIATASVKGLIETFADGTVKGFACKYGQEASVDVEIFIGGASGVGVFAGRTKANLAPADETDRQNLAKQCATTVALHRFSFVVPEALKTQNPGKAIFVHAIDVAASNKNFAIGDSGKYMIAGLPAKSCPEGYVMVPASNISGLGNPSAKAGHPDWWLDTSKDFCVMKYPAKNVGGVAKSVPEQLPWVKIPRGITEADAGSALKACKDIGVSYRLISNTQWQAVARNAENVASNWSGGAVGSGRLAMGHSDIAPFQALANSTDTSPYFGTENNADLTVAPYCSKPPFDIRPECKGGPIFGSNAGQRRTNRLSNGEVVWDFGGNVWQLVSDNYSDLNLNPRIDSFSWFDFSDTTQFPAASGSINRLLFAPQGNYNGGEPVCWNIHWRICRRCTPRWQLWIQPRCGIVRCASELWTCGLNRRPKGIPLHLPSLSCGPNRILRGTLVIWYLECIFRAKGSG